MQNFEFISMHTRKKNEERRSTKSTNDNQTKQKLMLFSFIQSLFVSYYVRGLEFWWMTVEECIRISDTYNQLLKEDL